MLKKEKLKSFQEESLIDSWYNNRAEDLYILNDVDKKKITEITKGEDNKGFDFKSFFCVCQTPMLVL